MAFRNVDVFVKPRADIRSKSVAGGIITLVASVAAVLLFCSELYTYIAGNRSHSLHMAPSTPFPMLARDKFDPFQSRAYELKGKMNLRLHITFLHISCNAIEVKLNGHPVTGKDMSARDGGLKRSTPNQAEIKKVFGAASAEEAQKHVGRGCTLRGTLRVPKVAGSVSVTLTREAWATALNHFMVRSKLSEEERRLDTHINDYNMSHFIHNIQFGQTIPASLLSHSSAVSSSHKYEEPMRDHVHIIENQMGGIALESIQVKKHVHADECRGTTVQPETMVAQGVSSQPGLSLVYDINPLSVVLNEGRENILVFVSSLCGIVGGVFVTVSLLTGCLVHSAAAVAKKVD
eukprot:CAMPEP_0113516116 /NCGR_PEP_ID=MMETSP0014_2-20120614/41359_1 /TAXON_ID=2857 /ORGANISM="Nitzschia sp." /LENGTH=346 /DNA_ID=CAMNT_0000412835 /DNA_START=40 /DNA_END=1081 /DNA_ORIENTATION=+ /assembly_acc=CAM_ASM_000159